MPRTIEIQYKDSLSVFSLTKLDRTILYGSKRRIPIDSNGQACTRACLTADGRYILPAGGWCHWAGYWIYESTAEWSHR